MSASDTPRKLWQPTIENLTGSNIAHYRDWLADQYGFHAPDYDTLWQWSVADPARFWESIWRYFDIRYSSPYEAVLSGEKMPGAHWFRGATLNYAGHIFAQANEQYPALITISETRPLREVSWQELRHSTAALATWLQDQGIQPGDRIAAFMPNIKEATIGFLAACSIGAVWSSCSQDFGAGSVIDRFQQIQPRILLAADGYSYNGKAFSRLDVIREIQAAIPSIEHTILVSFLPPEMGPQSLESAWSWIDIMAIPPRPLQFAALPFEHPIWILYSSGTTGNPKAITHSQGGMLLEHLKYLRFHNDVKPGERFFWFSTTGWMMWNFAHASLLCGATVVLYDGSPGYPDLKVLWQLAQQAGIHHFGTSAPYLVACMKAGIKPGADFDLSSLRSISSTGSPLPPEAFDYVYDSIKKDIWLCSMSGGTDVCTAFVGGCPIVPVYEGEIQVRALGCSLYAWDEAGQALSDELGEMVITKPMPCMPIYFWNDPEGEKYRSSYFEQYPGNWRHGDWVRITERGSLVIYGRSDATLNRQGVRIGTSEIYRAVDKIAEVRDSLIVNLELSGGRHFMPLFVQLNEGVELTDALIGKIAAQLKSDYSPRHVPDRIIAVPDIPYTISGKKMEAPVKKILLGMPLESSLNRDSMRNPDSLEFFRTFAKQAF